jgi:predicted DNA-binding transcriptional regulator AlpA
LDGAFFYALANPAFERKAEVTPSTDNYISPNVDRFVREDERRMLTGLSRTTWWRLERQGLAPKRRCLSGNATGWFLSEIIAWMQSRATRAA